MAASRGLPAILALEDGTTFPGRSFGATGESGGEVVFNTSMTGYQEIITDPSYRGQMVAMTYPHIGNYGVNDADVESSGPRLSGFIVREACRFPSHCSSSGSLPDYLAEHGVVGIEGVDTRALVLLIREKGALRGVISTEELRPDTLVDLARAVPHIGERNLVAEVTCKAPFTWTETPPGRTVPAGDLLPVVVLDCGVKRNILRMLAGQGCAVTVVPASTSAEEILALHPAGVLLSNGPGDPERLPAQVATARGLAGRVPLFGICLGHQVIGRALGGRTFKLKFGHHGGNHPVKDLATGRIAITSQNHNYAVDPATLPKDAKVTHLNLYDGTVEGLEHPGQGIFSVQYHPEAAPGPHDAAGLFPAFVRAVRRRGGA